MQSLFEYEWENKRFLIFSKHLLNELDVIKEYIVKQSVNRGNEYQWNQDLIISEDILIITQHNTTQKYKSPN